MRGAHNAQVGRDDQGQIFAINLGADFVAEHEGGIKQIYQSFGIDPKNIGVNPVGVDSRTNKQCPDNLVVQDFKKRKRPGNHSVGFKGTLLIFTTPWRIQDGIDPSELREFYDSPGRDGDMEPLTTAWSDNDFAIFARKDDEKQFLRDLFDAAQNNDMVVWLGGGGEAFRNAGLCLAIRSRMSDEQLQEFVDADNAQLALVKADEATGIKDRLKAAKEASGVTSYPYPYTYYALSPRAINEEMQEKRETAHPVVYWLNPCNQREVASGWYTVEDLDQWIAGEGPCIKEKKTA